jgi:hypothetical protein
VPDAQSLRARLARLSSAPAASFAMDHPIGCISIAFPTFFEPDAWVPLPPDWSRNIVSGRTYDLTSGYGRALWQACVERAVASRQVDEWTAEAAEQLRHGAPQVITPRLGQGSFRLAVIDAYGGACAVTTEHSLPVLEAAHIRPYAQGGRHEVRNGLPLRRDLHTLFDLGYVTVRPDRTFMVSRHLRDDYANGRVYYELDGRQILEPTSARRRGFPWLSRGTHRPKRPPAGHDRAGGGACPAHAASVVGDARGCVPRRASTSAFGMSRSCGQSCTDSFHGCYARCADVSCALGSVSSCVGCDSCWPISVGRLAPSPDWRIDGLHGGFEGRLGAAGREGMGAIALRDRVVGALGK